MRLAWQLGKLWYAGRFDEGWQPGAPLEKEANFTELGLTHPFWKLA